MFCLQGQGGCYFSSQQDFPDRFCFGRDFMYLWFMLLTKEVLFEREDVQGSWENPKDTLLDSLAPPHAYSKCHPGVGKCF